MSRPPITFVDARHTCPDFPIGPQLDLSGRVVLSKDGQPARWARRWPRPEPPKAICFHIVGAMIGASKQQIKRCGSQSAARLWRVTSQKRLRTYHWLTDHEERRIIRKLPSTVHSYHGDGSNRFAIGHCYEAGTVRGPFDWDLAIEGIVECVEAERADGNPIEFGYAHSQFSKWRGDPGEIYWRRAVMPAAKITGLVLDIDSKGGTGLPIPASWRVPFDTHAEITVDTNQSLLIPICE